MLNEGDLQWDLGSAADEAELERFLAAHEIPDNAIDFRAAVQALQGSRTEFRQRALLELAQIDLERRWDAGQQVAAGLYFSQAPDLEANTRVAVPLLLAECRHRLAHGMPFTEEQLAQRYPRLAALVWPRMQAAAAGLSTVSQRDHGDTDAGNVRKAVAAVLPQPFGRYEILRVLGEGGMGSVFLARDTQLQREVALKIPRLSRDSAEMRERFLREARAAAAVHHANLCPIYDVGEIDGIPYLTMRYITGTPLSQRLRGGPPAVTDAIAWTHTIALALAEAHRRGLLHRDLKPANILLEFDKEPVVLDFGLARLASNEVSLLTQPGVFMGTRPYAAPEQVRGDVSATGPPADVYSLGVIFYELLTGRRPFAAQNAARNQHKQFLLANRVSSKAGVGMLVPGEKDMRVAEGNGQAH